MMNYIWGGMIILSILYGAVNGTLGQVGEAALSSSKEAVSLCITMIGIMSFWVGIMEIAEDTGIIEGASGKMRPAVRFLFPNLRREGNRAEEYIISNMIANILGLGWAATPAGLKAMEELSKERDASSLNVASNEMCTFLILNISSLQLIPVNIIAYRSQYGSVNPTAVVGPGLVATTASTVAAVVFCKVMDRRRRK